ncbi:MAG TPA: ABC transporter substrate-binding protein [Gammaproteobacteria bacterium]
MNHRFVQLLAAGLILFIFAILCAPQVSAAADPQDVVRQASEHVLAELEREGSALTGDPQRLYALVDAVLLQHMDFTRMARWVLGKHWKTASADQQARFVAEFRRLLVRTYATALAGYSGQRIEFLPQRDGSAADEAVVRAEIRQPGGLAIPVQFSLFRSGEGWKAYDIVIDGISLVANYRTTFSAEVRNGGLDALILSLSARNQQALNQP